MTDKLDEIARKIRLTTFKAIAKSGHGHFGGCLSISEILSVLYFKVLKIDPKNPEDDNRDRFILSKGHGGPALYSAMALRGFFPVSELDNLDKPFSKFPKYKPACQFPDLESPISIYGSINTFAASPKEVFICSLA